MDKFSDHKQLLLSVIRAYLSSK